MPIKLIIFDLDGTLVDTSVDITKALNYAITPYGIRALEVSDVIKLVGEGITRLIEKALGERAFFKEEATKRFLEHYSAHLTDYSKAYPGVRETLSTLNNYKKVVISNKRESLSIELLKRLDLINYFDLVVGSDTTQGKKPSSEPVIYTLRNFSIPQAEAIMVGDSPFDIEAAGRTGIKSVAVTYGYRERKLLTSADYMIDKIEELPPLLEKLSNQEERRREKRHPVPPIYRDYIKLSINLSGEFIEAQILDFSRRGLRLSSPIPLEIDTTIQCIISIPKSLTRDASFRARVRHCSKSEERYIAGCEIESIEDELWFRVVEKVHDFIWQKDYFRENPK